MKKYVYSLVLLLSAGLVHAGGIAPTNISQTGQAIGAAESGYLISTAAFANNSNSTITIPSGYSEVSIGGVIFSSGSGATYVEFFSSSGWSPSVTPLLRIKNSSGVYAGATDGSIRMFPAPIRLLDVSGSTTTAVYWRVKAGEADTTHNLISVPYLLK